MRLSKANGKEREKRKGEKRGKWKDAERNEKHLKEKMESKANRV